jgi:hypothetical protein
VVEGEDARGAAGRSGSGRAERLVVRLGRDLSFRGRFGSGGSGDAFCGSAGVGFFFDAYQILVRDFPAEVLVLSALLEILFEEDRTSGISDESARGGQKDIAGAILHLHATPEKRGVASHPAPVSTGGSHRVNSTEGPPTEDCGKVGGPPKHLEKADEKRLNAVAVKASCKARG